MLRDKALLAAAAALLALAVFLDAASRALSMLIDLGVLAAAAWVGWTLYGRQRGRIRELEGQVASLEEANDLRRPAGPPPPAPPALGGGRRVSNP